MERKNFNTQKMVIAAMMIALEIILTRFVAISTPMLRIGFGFLPMVILAIYLGPIWAAGSYAAADVLGSLLFPSGAFFPGFTLSACLTGLIYGLILHRRKITVTRTTVAVAIVLIGVNLMLNTLWLTILLGKGYMALLPARAVKELVCIPIDTLMIFAVGKAASRVYRPAV